MAAQPNRPTPLMDPSRYKTYAVVSPLSTHFRKATCAETACPHYLNGWGVRVENCTPDLLHAARTSGRRYRELHVAEGENWLVFEPGQECFRASTHYLREERPPLFLVRDGDHRGNPRRTKTRQHLNPQTWVDDFAEHQQTLADEIKKG
jgi:hypothetical protein